MTDDYTFPHVCPGVGCAICARINLRQPFDARPMRETKSEDARYTDCRHCGELRIEQANGKLAPHVCPALRRKAS